MPDIKQELEKGLTGLANLGNTCFINTCIQILSHTHELNNVLDSDKYEMHLKNSADGILIREWNTLRKLMWSQNCVIEPSRFIQIVQGVAKHKGQELFTGYSQNDVSEFLLFVVDCFHNSLSRPVTMNIKGKSKTGTDDLAVVVYNKIKNMYAKEYSEIWNMFYGMHVSELVSIDGQTILSQTPEPFFNISLSIPTDLKQPTLSDCFENYVRGEVLSGDNAWYNEKTKEKQDVIKRIRYWGFPNILCIDFKRIDATNKKKHTIIDFPLDNLSMEKYVLGYNAKSYVYELYGVCNHHGSALGGHYTAFIKGKIGKWYEFNDTRITMLSSDEHIVSPTAYCLFYRKKSNV
jgi:ubiquitin carboxyl-terminal hydrolase 8